MFQWANCPLQYTYLRTNLSSITVEVDSPATLIVAKGRRDCLRAAERWPNVSGLAPRLAGFEHLATEPLDPEARDSTLLNMAEWM